MSREIKFRAWVANDTKTKHKMLNVTDLCFMRENDDDTGEEVYVAASEGWRGDNERYRFSLSNAVLMQFIGLRDKKGNGIYEGDIVRWRYMEEGTGVVKYSDKYASWQPFNQLRYESVVDTFEVIGNIYENTELLK
jgi:uncharacterized phage protein (TIGR01671 family)